MPIGIIVLGLGTAGCAFAHELWHFYLLFGILAPIGTAFSGWPLLAPALANWFAKRRGLVLGLGQIGGGLSFTYCMFAEYTISLLGWRYAYLVLSAILVALLLPLYLLFHYRPENKGMRAYGATEIPGAEGLTGPSRDWTLGRAMRTYQLWLLVLSVFLYWGVGTYLILAHQIKFVEEAGYSSMFATSVFALFGIFMVAGQLSASISDWIGREKTITLVAYWPLVAWSPWFLSGIPLNPGSCISMPPALVTRLDFMRPQPLPVPPTSSTAETSVQ